MTKTNSTQGPWPVAHEIRSECRNNRWPEGFQENQLTVLCYHRVIQADDKRFHGYKPNISASVEAFNQQLDYLQAHYNLIGLCDLVAWLNGNDPLPPRPALVTFDDGYRDNADVVWPIMRSRGVPLVIFLATDYIGSNRFFIWDFGAYCFTVTGYDRCCVPLIGPVDLYTEAQRDAATMAWVQAVKRIPGSMREEAARNLAVALGVSQALQDIPLRHLYMDWTDVQRLAQQGVEFGGHTRSHPILSRIPLCDAREEIQWSVEQIMKALGKRPLGFAYPNGLSGDYSVGHEKAVRECGVPVAFSLEPGPTQLSRVYNRPTAIRRILVTSKDNPLRFIMKLNGLAYVANVIRESRQIFTRMRKARADSI